MPELPEVEVTRRGLVPLLTGHTIKEISWSNKKLRSPMPRKMLREWVLGLTITKVDRRAKYLLVRLDNKATVIFHLGMTGRMSLMPGKKPLGKHDHLRLLLDNGNELRFNDARRFGAIYVLPPGRDHERHFFANSGPEPLSGAFSADYLLGLAQSRKIPVKNFLMDGRVVAGIGNIYANEILFAASINPEKPANKISKTKWREVVEQSRRILRKSIKAGGSSISDFLNANGEAGYFQVSFKVYNLQGKSCSACKTAIKKTVTGGRATYFCPTCQK